MIPYLPLALSLSLSFSLTIFLALCLSLYLSISLSYSHYLSIYLSIYLATSPSTPYLINAESLIRFSIILKSHYIVFIVELYSCRCYTLCFQCCLHNFQCYAILFMMLYFIVYDFTLYIFWRFTLLFMILHFIRRGSHKRANSESKDQFGRFGRQWKGW